MQSSMMMILKNWINEGRKWIGEIYLIVGSLEQLDLASVCGDWIRGEGKAMGLWNCGVIFFPHFPDTNDVNTEYEGNEYVDSTQWMNFQFLRIGKQYEGWGFLIGTNKIKPHEPQYLNHWGNVKMVLWNTVVLPVVIFTIS